MAAASDEYMPSDEDVDVAVFWDENGGVQPYRFEPQRGDSDGDNLEEEEPQDDDNPFQNDIDFGARVGQRVNEWCACDLCRPFDVPVMNFCCHELEELQTKLFTDDLDCITRHRDFTMVVLEEAVLRTALVAMKDVKKTTLVEPIKERYVSRMPSYAACVGEPLRTPKNMRLYQSFIFRF